MTAAMYSMMSRHTSASFAGAAFMPSFAGLILLLLGAIVMASILIVVLELVISVWHRKRQSLA